MIKELRTVRSVGNTVDEEDLEDNEGVQDEREIWEVTHVCEQELETTEGEGVDLLSELLYLSLQSPLLTMMSLPLHLQNRSS